MPTASATLAPRAAVLSSKIRRIFCEFCGCYSVNFPQKEDAHVKRRCAGYLILSSCSHTQLAAEFAALAARFSDDKTRLSERTDVEAVGIGIPHADPKTRSSRTATDQLSMENVCSVPQLLG